MKCYPACILLLLALASCDGPEETSETIETPTYDVTAKPSNTKAIQDVFLKYKQAILSQDGPTALDCVTQRTIDEYQKYIDWSRTANREALESLSSVNKVQVFILKHRVSKDELLGMDGATVFAHAVNNDWIGKEGTIQTTITDIRVSSPKATAAVLLGNEVGPTRFHFIKENDGWKFDLVHTLHESSSTLKTQITESGLEENEFIFHVLESISGTKVTEDIWEPLEGP